MKKFENPKIVCTCEGENHTCDILRNAANNPQHQDTVESMSLDTDSNSSVATNAGNVPPLNEDSGIDTLLNVPVPSVTSGYSSANTSPDMDMLRVPSVSASFGTDTTPDTDNETSSGIASMSASSSVSDPHSISAKARNAGDSSTVISPSVPPPRASTVTDTPPVSASISTSFFVSDPHSISAKARNAGDSSTVISPSVPPRASTVTDTPPVSAASNPETPEHEAGGPSTSSKDDAATKSPSRPTNFSSGMRRTYSEFSKTDTEDDDSILKCITYVTSEDMVAKKKKTDEDADPKAKSSSSSGSRSRTASTSRSVESRDTSIENLSGCSADPLDDNDWYVRMRTRGPKISITGSVRPDGTIDETEEHRSSAEGGSLLSRPVGTIDETEEHGSSAEGGSLLARPVGTMHEAEEHGSSAGGGNLLSVNPPPEGDICENIYFGRKSPSLAGDENPTKQDENQQPKKEDEGKDNKDNDGS